MIDGSVSPCSYSECFPCRRRGAFRRHQIVLRKRTHPVHSFVRFALPVQVPSRYYRGCPIFCTIVFVSFIFANRVGIGGMDVNEGCEGNIIIHFSPRIRKNKWITATNWTKERDSISSVSRRGCEKHREIGRVGCTQMLQIYKNILYSCTRSFQ